MKFSSSLLEDRDIGNKMYENSVKKVKTFLKDIFGLSFEGPDSALSFTESLDNRSFNVVFRINDRVIEAYLSYVPDDSGQFISETLVLCDSENENILIPGSVFQGENEKSEYWSNVNRIQDFLEGKFEINFTPLNLEERDANITEISACEENLTWWSSFKNEPHEGLCNVSYCYKSGSEQFITITHDKHHMVYLD